MKGCKECGCTEFVSNLNRYDIYVAEDGYVFYRYSELINEKIELSCRECFTQLSDKEIDKYVRDHK